MISQTVKTYEIDAAGQTLGRVASAAAVALRGKNQLDFERHISPKIKVRVVNIAQLKLMPQRQKTYARYSGYPGGLRFESLEHLKAKKGLGEALRLAVRGMLPNNKLRPGLIKNLIINE